MFAPFNSSCNFPKHAIYYILQDYVISVDVSLYTTQPLTPDKLRVMSGYHSREHGHCMYIIDVEILYNLDIN